MRVSIIKVTSFILLIISATCSCQNEVVPEVEYVTKNVIVIVMDGARFSETWGDSSHQNIPHLSKHLAPMGVINSKFYNNGPTYTSSGHTSITTGFYQEINNSGNELPLYPSFFQYWNSGKVGYSERSWIIASKDKLEVLSNCQLSNYRDLFIPKTDCGIAGLGSGYRDDSTTYNNTIKILSQFHPNLILVNLKDPDSIAHQSNWDKYLESIKNSDTYIYQIWNFINEDPIYQGKTTLFVTNDHGRHLNDVLDGYVSHGDDCDGCRHLLFYAYGPDFKQGVIIESKGELIDITATISELLHLDMRYSKGKIMYELLK